MMMEVIIVEDHQPAHAAGSRERHREKNDQGIEEALEQNRHHQIDDGVQDAVRAAIERCPTGAIVWLEPEAGPAKGAAAKKIIRKGALLDAPT